MDFPLFLAMTAAEFANCEAYPPKIAYMSCHFSSSDNGLSGIPKWLPPGSVLMFTDVFPPNGHNSKGIAEELAATVEQLNCAALLLDLQRPNLPENKALAKIAASLPCPVAVSAEYAKDLTCGVLLPPLPLWTLFSDYLQPWKGRRIWLEAAIDGAEVTVTENDSIYTPCYSTSLPSSFPYEALHIDYHMQIRKDRVLFHLRRDRCRLNELLREAEKFGIQGAVGLYQQFG